MDRGGGEAQASSSMRRDRCEEMLIELATWLSVSLSRLEVGGGGAG